MNRFMTVLVLVVAVAIGLGFYLDYFHMSMENTEGHTHITFTVNKHKFMGDETKAVDKIHDIGHQGHPSK